jgi:hypothetical protein
MQTEQELRELFMQPAWKRFITELAAWKERVERGTIYSVKSMEDVWRLRGHTEIIDWVLAYQNNQLPPIDILDPLSENPQEEH